MIKWIEGIKRIKEIKEGNVVADARERTAARFA
jgi:hypothetical protein